MGYNRRKMYVRLSLSCHVELYFLEIFVLGLSLQLVLLVSEQDGDHTA